MDWTPIALVVGIFTALVGVIWKQSNDKMNEHKQHCDEEIEKLWNQIGRDSNSGMRSEVHKIPSLQSALLLHGEWLRRLQGQEDER